MNTYSLNVLIVEDDLSFSIELGMLVEEIGYQVAGRVDNAEEAQALIEQKVPDFILLDIDLKGKMTGLELGEAQLPTSTTVQNDRLFGQTDQRFLAESGDRNSCP